MKNPVDDCHKIIDLLCSKYSFSKAQVSEIYNEAATRDNILNALSSYRTLTAEDNLLIIFSGHGYYDKAGDEGFWIPSTAASETQFITINDIARHLKAYKAHHVTLIVDSCFSGAMTRVVSVEDTYQAPTKL